MNKNTPLLKTYDKNLRTFEVNEEPIIYTVTYDKTLINLRSYNEYRSRVVSYEKIFFVNHKYAQKLMMKLNALFKTDKFEVAIINSLNVEYPEGINNTVTPKHRLTTPKSNPFLRRL